MTGNIADAIKRVETSRATHVAWRDYWLEKPECNDCAKCQADMAIAGDLERQIRLIAEYDNVLEVLHAYDRRLRGSAWKDEDDG